MSDLKDMLVIENGERANPTFTAAEMTSRLTKLRGHMAANDIDAVVFSSMHNIHYYSDFLYCSFGRPYALVVTQERATTVAANIDYGQPGRRSGDNLTYTDWRRDNYFRAVAQLVGDAKRIGVEFDHINVENLEKMKAALPDAAFSNIAHAAMAMRMVKSTEEIALIESATAIADIGGLKSAISPVLDVITPIVMLAFLYGVSGIIQEFYTKEYKNELNKSI